ncbi:hypothetical protein BO70DRAFT_426472 [Aspergillus heteromorphus CBS 117.55]|uniref:Flavoprotein oxygenase n=1 Tax=Aspergillus heteromorphus CBS 117.55 TaxID=1448321 RepID=A0A317WUI0_9EURO|nr:uncharacterized protein BO70DRAFT_426472 [Aspergillus heteromorphus CBS 117.55]PWY90083.1 hypothetical protein BO70DRAFT_426472 [Aspergillus heteromorphus CBS 117.55]
MDDHPHNSQFTDDADFTTGEERSVSPGSAYEQSPTSPRSTNLNLEIEPRYEYHDDPDRFHEDTPMLAQDCGYNSSGSSAKHSSDILSGGDLDEDLGRVSSRASSRSSVSSIPASVLTNMADGTKLADIQDHMLSRPWDDHDRGVNPNMEGQLRTLPAIRQRESIFRKPSSVKAMQMHTEDEGDDEFLTPPKRRSGQRFSDVSMRSTGSSPFRKSQFYSPTGSATKQKVKKEYPLVLLHCNLLPPSLPVPTAMGYINQKVLKDVLPSEYWRRWKLLEEKIGSGVLRERGVLISHPEDLYDLLEERLLESLELQRPRLDHGHFLGRDENDCEGLCVREREESATDEEEGEECLDCGGRVVPHNNAGRKWEIRVFAANGLMRAGAWAAAWKEMEKVDVEVSLWLPSEIRRELEKRLLEDEMHHFEKRLEQRLQVPRLQAPENENENENDSDMAVHPQSRSLQACTPTPTTEAPPHPHPIFTPEQIEGKAPPPPSSSSPVPEKETPPKERRQPEAEPIYVPRSSEDIDLQTLLVNYIRVLASDRRNVAIAILSTLVLFLAVHSGPQTNQSALRPFPSDILEPASVSGTSSGAGVSMVQPSSASSTGWNMPASCVVASVETADTVETARVAEVRASASESEDGRPSVPVSRSVRVSSPTPSTLAVEVDHEDEDEVEEKHEHEDEDLPHTETAMETHDPPKLPPSPPPPAPGISSPAPVEGLLAAAEPQTPLSPTEPPVTDIIKMEDPLERLVLVEPVSPAVAVAVDVLGTSHDHDDMGQ